MPTPREIPKYATVCVGAGAFLAFGFAGYATLETDNEVGTGGFVLVGLYLAIVAITGRLPRIKFGENEIDPRAIAETAAARTADALEGVATLTAKASVGSTADGVAVAVRNAGPSIVATSAYEALQNPSTSGHWGSVRRRFLGDLYDGLPVDVRMRLINYSGALPGHRDPSDEGFAGLALGDQVRIGRAMDELGLTDELEGLAGSPLVGLIFDGLPRHERTKILSRSEVESDSSKIERFRFEDFSGDDQARIVRVMESTGLTVGLTNSSSPNAGSS